MSFLLQLLLNFSCHKELKFTLKLQVCSAGGPKAEMNEKNLCPLHGGVLRVVLVLFCSKVFGSGLAEHL